MELLSLVQHMQKEEYILEQKQNALRHLCGYDLTDYQIGVLMSNTETNSQTIYRSQQRQQGTSTALLLKVYQSIFIENKLNHKYIISQNNTSASYMKNQMMNILGRANLLQYVRRDSRYRIELENGCVIHFENNNPLNLRGIATGPEFFFDDYSLVDEVRNEELNNCVRTSYPIHIHYFLANTEFEQEMSELLFG